MKLSVVVPTLNGRERLSACLDALSARAPEAEVVIVNGPSADGTTGMVRERDDVDVLVEVADRKLNVARNAGIAEATGEVVALVGQDTVVEESWADAVRSNLDDAAVVTGPVHRSVRAGMTTESEESLTIGGRDVTYFDGGNVAFDREVLTVMDGFDEYLLTGGARDCAHRLANAGHEVSWSSDVGVTRNDGDDDDDRDWGWKYRALAYRLVKNYGPRPGVFGRTVRDAVCDAAGTAADVARGEGVPSEWFGNGKRVVTNMSVGYKDGLLARAKDRTESRNPYGLSARADRAVERYDWRE
ncbi:glycosyltransferase family 2 protein [Halorussus salilacus]|uniref:glycosyltransferase family 2 protein n=1 Tax=Halorussus salilacus TaxID=2953750 RepID=UPI00209E494B|nr:glycosyltransferase family A protein [Halorussus salilacus]USZ68949.1 glycosyltransferase family 2 protein [Halorussus salilacus]